MFKIRKDLFETNSSSTHSLTMCPKEDYEKWKNGEVYFCSNGEFYTKEEIIELSGDGYYNVDIEHLKHLSNEDFDKYAKDYKFYTLKNYNSDCLEYFYDEYTTKSGETIVVFGKYGWD